MSASRCAGGEVGGGGAEKVGEVLEGFEVEVWVEAAEEVAESADGAGVPCFGDVGELEDPVGGEGVEECCDVLDAAAFGGVFDEVDSGELPRGNSMICRAF